MSLSQSCQRLADEIAHTAVPHGGISFGTNDLTQTALGMSRDDSGGFRPGTLNWKS